MSDTKWGWWLSGIMFGLTLIFGVTGWSLNRNIENVDLSMKDIKIAIEKEEDNRVEADKTIKAEFIKASDELKADISTRVTREEFDIIMGIVRANNEGINEIKSILIKAEN